MAVSLTRKLSGAACLLLFLAGTALAFWPYVSASNDMRSFCKGLAVGISKAEVQALAAAQAYEVVEPGSGALVVHDARSFGRLQCKLRFDAEGRLGSAAFDTG